MKRAWDIFSKSSWSELGLIARGFTSIISDQDTPLSFNSSMLHIAAKAKNAEFLRKKLEENSEGVNEADSKGWTPLHISAYLNDIASVRVLLEYGANIKARTCDGNTPIMLSADLLSAEVTKCLMDLGEMLPNIPLERTIIDTDGKRNNVESFLRELSVDPQPVKILDQSSSLGGLAHDSEE